MSIPATVSAIVVSMFGGDAFLPEAVDSLKRQSHKPHQIIEIRQQGSLAEARNAGLAAATGEYVLFLDGDNRLTQSGIASNLARLKNQPDAAMAYGGHRFIDRMGKPTYDMVRTPVGGNLYAALLERNWIATPGACLYRRDRLQAAGGFDAGIDPCADYALHLRFAREQAMVGAGEVIAEIRQHDSDVRGNPVEALTAARRVLAAQAPHVMGHQDLVEAQGRGISWWKNFHSRRQLILGKRMLQRHADPISTLGGLARMLATSPLAMFRAGSEELLGDPEKDVSREISWGDLDRTTPISTEFGFDRGRPVDRKYVEDFLQRSSHAIAGRVLEIGDNSYTLNYGGDRVALSEVLHVDPDAPNVTYCTDLTHGDGIPDNLFDCVVLTQTLQFIYDFRAAVATVHRVLKPGGKLLLTVPGVSSVDRGEWGDVWFWSFTPASLRRVLEEQFRPEDIALDCHGNVQTAIAFLHGLADRELRPDVFDMADPHYPVIITALVEKA